MTRREFVIKNYGKEVVDICSGEFFSKYRSPCGWEFHHRRIDEGQC